MKLDINNIEVINIEGIDTKDYPDFCDAFISEAKWISTGNNLTEEELDEINSNYSDFVYECILESIQ